MKSRTAPLAALALAALALTACSATETPDTQPTVPAASSYEVGAAETSADAAAATEAPVEQSPTPAWQDYSPEQVEWCSNITTAWDAYFQQKDEPTAVSHLQAAAAADPGSFGWVENAVHTRAIDRDVRFIDGGVDSQYVEYTANGCWDWAERVGVDIP